MIRKENYVCELIRTYIYTYILSIPGYISQGLTLSLCLLLCRRGTITLNFTMIMKTRRHGYGYTVATEQRGYILRKYLAQLAINVRPKPQTLNTHTQLIEILLVTHKNQHRLYANGTCVVHSTLYNVHVQCTTDIGYAMYNGHIVHCTMYNQTTYKITYNL